MHCYRHTNSHAVAICRNCGKAACPDCCDDTEQSVACSSKCADEIRNSLRLQHRLEHSFGIGAQPPMPASVPTYALFGLILLTTGFYFSLTRPGIDFLTFAFAAVFFVMAGATYRRYRSVCLAC